MNALTARKLAIRHVDQLSTGALRSWCFAFGAAGDTALVERLAHVVETLGSLPDPLGVARFILTKVRPEELELLLASYSVLSPEELAQRLVAEWQS